MTAKEIAEGLTEAQKSMILESEPGGWGSDKRSCGVTLELASHYSTARALERRGLGDAYPSPTKGMPGLYFNNADGLEVRTILETKP